MVRAIAPLVDRQRPAVERLGGAELAARLPVQTQFIHQPGRRLGEPGGIGVPADRLGMRRQGRPDLPGADIIGIARGDGIHGVQGDLQRGGAVGRGNAAAGDLLHQPVDQDRVA